MSLRAAVEGTGLAVVGALSAGVLVFTGEGGVVSMVTGAVSNAALAAAATIGVALIKRDGDARAQTLARIEASTSTLAEKVDEHHAELLQRIADHGERLAKLEGRVPAADERQREVDKLKQDVARLQGHLRRD